VHTPAAPTTVTDRCPQCRGLVRPDAAWCTQCWTDLRPVAAAGPEPVVAAAPAVGPGAGGPGAQRSPQPGGWPCSGCGASNAVELDRCAACGLGFLSGLSKSEPPLLVLPVVGDLAVLSRAQRLGVAGVVVLLVVLLTALASLPFA
jgi:hypothetical protein